MKIISPVDHAAEAPLLLDAGADELYGGYLPREWSDRFGLLASVNQRTFEGAQLTDKSELVQVLKAVRERGKTFSLTLNAPFYTDEQLPLLLELTEEAVEAGVDGVILADLGLLRLLVRRFPRLQYHASTLAHLSNSAALSFYAGQGVSRAILPRHLSLREMREMVETSKDMLLDAFLLVGKCPNTEGLCTFHHSSPDRIWPCEIPYRIAPLHGGGTEDLGATMRRQGSWSQTDRRHGCGLCAIPALLEMNLHGVKLVGRGAAAAHKVQNVQLTRELIDLARQEDDFTIYRQAAIAAHHRRFGAACSRNICYYPELLEEI